MSIGILFESQEWSSTALCAYVRQEGIDACLIDLEQDINIDEILSHKLIVNRVFASAQFRNHSKSLDIVKDVLDEIREMNIPLINQYEAHFYETSKFLAAQTLEKFKLPSPEIYDCFVSGNQPNFMNIEYPCILKPNCGGRTNYTYIIRDEKEFRDVLNSIDLNIEFIVQQFIEPVKGYITRIEVIGGECYSILKRTVTDGGLSAYNLGSKYLDYDDCPNEIKQAAKDTMKHLKIDMGSLDIIENGEDFYIIDVNSVSNFAPENIEMFGYNMIQDMAKYIATRYKAI